MKEHNDEFQLKSKWKEYALIAGTIVCAIIIGLFEM